MKYVITFLVGGLMGFFIMWQIASVQRRTWESRYLSEVVMPTEYAISDVNRDLKSGHIPLVRKKLEALDQGYQEFRKGGPRPEIFLKELYRSNEENQHQPAPYSQKPQAASEKR